MRGSVSRGFRAPTPGQQNGFNISSWFDPTVGDLVNNAVIPSISPAARLRGGLPLGPEQSVNYTAGVVFDSGSFTLTADYFHIDVSDRIGITSNFYLTDAEVADLVAGGFDAAESVRNFRFFTNAFATSSRGIDIVSTYTPLALRGNIIISAAFNHTDHGFAAVPRVVVDQQQLPLDTPVRQHPDDKHGQREFMAGSINVAGSATRRCRPSRGAPACSRPPASRPATGRTRTAGPFAGG